MRSLVALGNEHHNSDINMGSSICMGAKDMFLATAECSCFNVAGKGRGARYGN